MRETWCMLERLKITLKEKKSAFVASKLLFLVHCPCLRS